MTMATRARVPLRTCVACRQVRAKHELVRLVRGGNGVVMVDAPAVAPGRGAYVCAAAACAVAVTKPGRLARAFRKPCTVGADLSEEVRELWQRGR